MYKSKVVKIDQRQQSFRNIFSFFLGVILIIFTVTPTQPVYAAPTIWYVTTTGNDFNSCITVASPCLTIKGAIGKATSGDTIYVAAGTYTGSGAQVVLINKSITLSGGWDTTFTTQSGTSIIDGQGARRGITMPINITVTLDNFTIQNGFHATQGGGILNNGGTLTINNSAIKNNISHWLGGGIDNYGTLMVNNTVISGNSAGEIGHSGGGGGGGIQNWNWSIATLNNSTVSDNILLGFFDGTAINNSAILILNNSTVSNNTNSPSINYTASIYSTSSFGSVTINNTTINGNTGAGILGNNLSINNSTISNNLHGVNGTGTVSDSIVANNTNFDCNGPITSGGYNLIGDGSGCKFSSTTGDLVGTSLAPIDPKLGPLQSNGGPTFTHALLWGSPAIDAGNPAAPGSGGNACLSTDQRGVTRPINTTCDIGAYEYGASILTVTNTTPASGATLQSISSILVTFSENALSNSSANAANNTVNYILVEDGANSTFDTVSCSGGLVADDIRQTISSISYNSTSFTATLNLASSLPPGNYRLFICGTTSIYSAAGLELNNGASDTVVNFTITASASPLPETGFAPNRITSLPLQPANLAYATLGSIWLEIPTLNVRENIVGVPQSNSTWNLSWLGNNIGWLNGTAFPSWEGNSVLTAHLYNANGLPGSFVNLKDLKYGDQIIVHLYGEKYIYEVRSSNLTGSFATEYALEHLEDHSYLTLITCQGYDEQSDSYRYRRIVRAVLVDVK